MTWYAMHSYHVDVIRQNNFHMERNGNCLSEILNQKHFFENPDGLNDDIELNLTLYDIENVGGYRITIIGAEHVFYDSDHVNNVKGFFNETLEKHKVSLGKDIKISMDEAFQTKAPVFLEDSQFEYCILSVLNDVSREDAKFVVLRCDKVYIFKDYNDIWHHICGILIAVVIVILLVAFMYSRKFIQPLKQLVGYIGRITEGYLNEKIDMHSFSEVNDIVDSINSMTTKLETLESSRQEFVSNVSHELKTPITSIKVLADSLLQQEDAPAELYREFLVDITAEIERENKIITDLLSLVKMDKSECELNISSVNINELCEQILKRIRPIAAERNIDLNFESFRPVIAEVDEVKLSLAINNLIENAVKYNYDNGWVRVSLNADHKFFYIKVSDSGVGIPADEQENVFERFYRVDKARSRDTGGTGLGLAITRNAILVHKGAIKIYSKEKEGTTFTVRIPLNHTN